MILKPFMLRRIKKDVENELTDKLEVLVYCPLTTRQKLLYMGLKRKIRIEDLLQGLGSQSQNSAIASSLMNLVMQFRKVSSIGTNTSWGFGIAIQPIRSLEHDTNVPNPKFGLS
jgi:SNF2 family DNA or RNA helicase